MHPENADLQFSQETICQAIYAMPKGELRAEAVALLRFGYNKRDPRVCGSCVRGKDRRGQAPDMVPDMARMQDRAAEIAECLVPGHCEGDTIKGRYKRSALGALVDRKTLFSSWPR